MNTPESPLGNMAMAAVSLHEMFQAYVTAGFTEEQALDLTKHVLTINQPGGQP